MQRTPDGDRRGFVAAAPEGLKLRRYAKPNVEQTWPFPGAMNMAFAIKAEVRDPLAGTFAFTAQKTMYGGKHIAEGDTVFVFASENEGGPGLIARGLVISAEAIAKKPG